MCQLDGIVEFFRAAQWRRNLVCGAKASAVGGGGSTIRYLHFSPFHIEIAIGLLICNFDSVLEAVN